MSNIIFIMLILIGLLAITSLPVALIALFRNLKSKQLAATNENQSSDKEVPRQNGAVKALIIVVPSVLLVLFALGMFSFWQSSRLLNQNLESSLQKSQEAVNEFNEVQNSVTVKIGKFVYKPEYDDSGYAMNEKGGLTVTLKNSAKFDVDADIMIVALAPDGHEIKRDGIGTGFTIKAGQTRTYTFFKYTMDAKTERAMATATFKEAKNSRLIFKSDLFK